MQQGVDLSRILLFAGMALVATLLLAVPVLPQGRAAQVVASRTTSSQANTTSPAASGSQVVPAPNSGTASGQAMSNCSASYNEGGAGHLYQPLAVSGNVIYCDTGQVSP